MRKSVSMVFKGRGLNAWRMRRRLAALALTLTLGANFSPAYCAESQDILPDGDAATAAGNESKRETGTAQDGGASSDSTGDTATNATAAGASTNLKVDDVKIEGNRLISSDQILNVVKTKRGDTFDRDQVLEDLKAINSMGYFDDRSLQVTPELTGGGVLLKIRVQENAPITQFAFQGNQVLSSEELSRVFSNQLGKPQNLNDLSQAIDKVEQLYHQNGYVLARVTDVKDDPDGSVALSINEGELEGIEIAGNRKTKDFIIRSALKLKSGMPYNEKQLTADLRKLYANGYFQDIRRSLSPSTANPDKYVLKVEVDERRTGSIGLGGGVDSIAGPFGSFSFSDANFRGRGQVVSFNSQIGSGVFGQGLNAVNNPGNGFLVNRKSYQLEATFVEPSLKGSKTSLAVSGFGRNFSSLLIDQSTQRTLGASATFSRPLGKHLTANLGLIGENTSLRDFSSTFGSDSVIQQMSQRALETGQALSGTQAELLASQVRNDQLKGGTFMTVNPSITYDTRDAPFDASRGTFAKMTAGPSLGLTGASFAKLGASVSKYIPVAKGVTLATNIQGGSALGGVPQFAQYRLGGWNGIRGYRMFSDLGTGSSMLMATAELRTRLPLPKSSSPVLKAIDKHIKGVAFFDAGQVTGNSLTNSLYGRSTLGAAVGVGLRVNVPMLGLVRFEYGLPLVSSILGRMTPRFTIGFGERF